VRVRLTQELRFEAAHLLPRAPEGHKCRRLHGHSFHIEVTVEGHADPETGWFLDYGAIKKALEPVHKELDHRYLNEVQGLENPTSEHLCVWVWRRLKPALPSLSRVTVRETCEARCEYRGDET
jgi:6-pyruvoyltetrahydropterin/6-carboxytetrahydropterin synthase